MTSIYRTAITDYLIEDLKLSDLPVGDTNVPETTYGWQTDQPDAEDSQFIPWMVLRAGRVEVPGGSVGDPSTEYKLFYSVEFAGVHRKQTDWIADTTRARLVRIKKESVSHAEGNWRIQQIRCTGIGGISRVSSAFPDYYIQSDSYEVWVSKERS